MKREGRKGRKARVGFASIAGVAFMSLAAPALAQSPHVRGEDGTRQPIDDAARLSPAIRASIDRLRVAM